MKSVKTVYKMGNGPSSSHTVAPFRAAKHFLNKYPDGEEYEAILYGSLAFTGNGHGTGKAIASVIKGIKIINDRQTQDLPHPNTMDFICRVSGKEMGRQRYLSIGGGSLYIEGEAGEDEEVYKEKNFTDFICSCKENQMNLARYAYYMEGDSLKEYIHNVWLGMQDCVERGLKAEGVLPGGLNISRKAKMLYEMRCHNETSDITSDRIISAYSYAVSEENADEHVVVTAPTCGACGVIPAILYYMSRNRGFSDEEIEEALVVAGVVGNVIRTNASISGAEAGCQAEIGSACSMAAAGLAHLYNMSLDQIEYAAEVAMEHHLGLTCDAVMGLVQIPCIERNAVAAMRAINAVNLSRFLYKTRKISLDDVIKTMYQTGKDLKEEYRETSNGGLAKLYE